MWSLWLLKHDEGKKSLFSFSAEEVEVKKLLVLSWLTFGSKKLSFEVSAWGLCTKQARVSKNEIWFGVNMISAFVLTSPVFPHLTHGFQHSSISLWAEAVCSACLGSISVPDKPRRALKAGEPSQRGKGSSSQNTRGFSPRQEHQELCSSPSAAFSPWVFFTECPDIPRVQRRRELLPCLALSWCFQG